jgi:hypothetical protein
MCRTASLFDRHGVRTEATPNSFMKASGNFLLHGLSYTYGHLKFTNNIVLDGHFFCLLPPELCNKYSFHCNQIFEFNNIFYSNDTRFSTTATLAPLVAKLFDSSTTFSKLNLMTSKVTSLEGVGEDRVRRPPRKA